MACLTGSDHFCLTILASLSYIIEKYSRINLLRETNGFTSPRLDDIIQLDLFAHSRDDKFSINFNCLCVFTVFLLSYLEYLKSILQKAEGPCGYHRSLTLSAKQEGSDMITALVQFKLPEALSRVQAQEIFSGTAPKYRAVQGLIRKYYILSEDGKTAGGVYLWKSREDAERLYTDDWKEFILEKYGSNPFITYFESPVIVDNIAGEIVKDRSKKRLA